MFYVYALYNELNKKIYIGQTEDLDKRIIEHNDLNCDRHKYTSSFRGKWVLIYQEETETRSEALIREKQLKSFRGREFIKAYIPR